ALLSRWLHNLLPSLVNFRTAADKSCLVAHSNGTGEAFGCRPKICGPQRSNSTHLLELLNIPKLQTGLAKPLKLLIFLTRDRLNKLEFFDYLFIQQRGVDLVQYSPGMVVICFDRVNINPPVAQVGLQNFSGVAFACSTNLYCSRREEDLWAPIFTYSLIRM